MRRTLRYALASVGPFGSAATQFLLSLILIHRLAPSAFGTFSFLLVTAQLSLGIWSALFTAPMLVLVNGPDRAARAAIVRCLFSASLAATAGAFVLFLVIGLTLGQGTAMAALFAGFAALSLLRWYARAYAYATGRQARTIASDVVYALVLLAGTATIAFADGASLTHAYMALLAAAAIGLVPFGRTYLRAQLVDISLREVAGYGAVWRAHSGWSLVGVLTTEATLNCHAYLITALYGPGVFAAIAASQLTLRPLTVSLNAMMEYERAQMARSIGQDDLPGASRARRTFRTMLGAVWLGTIAVVGAVFLFAPRLIFPAKYSLHFLVMGAALWMLVGGVRLLRAPESALLQAMGAFRPLATASLVSAGFSIVGVLALVAIGGPLWSIAGVLIGDVLFAAATWRFAHRLLANRRTCSVPVAIGAAT